MTGFHLRRGSVAVALAAALAACSANQPSPSTPPAATQAPGATTVAGALPPLGDVPLYRTTTTANSISPGPGPTGKPELAWRTEVGAMHMVPILVGGLLIVGTNAGELVALDARTGSERWSAQVGSGQIQPSLASLEGLVYASDGGAVHAVKLSDGTAAWSTPLEGAGGRLNVVDGIVYVGTTGGVVGLDGKTGTETWRWSGGPTDVGVNAGPIADGVGYFATSDARVFAVDVKTAEVKWSMQTITTNIASGQVAGDTFYVSNNEGEGVAPVGEIYAVDRASGTVRWRFRTPSGLQVKEGPIKDGILYANAREDGIWALRDEGTTVRVVWHVDAPPSHWPMTLAGETLYVVRIDGSVGAYGIADGRLLWETPSEGDWAGGPIVSGGMVFVNTDTKGVLAYADPGLIAALPSAPPPATSGPSAAPTLEPVVNPFTRVRSYGLAYPCFHNVARCDPKPGALDISAGTDGLLYILDTTPQVQVIDPADGHVVRKWGSQGAGPGQLDLRRADDNPGNGGIAVAPDGNVYVADGSNYRVQAFKPNGDYLFQFGSFGSGPGQFGQLDHIAVGEDGSVYAQEDYVAITKFTANGKLVWRSEVNGHDLAVRSDGMLLVPCPECGHLMVLSPEDGSVVEQMELHEIGTDYGPISLDADGNIYLSLYGGGPIVDGRDVSGAMLVFDPTGQFIGGNYIDPEAAKRQDYSGSHWPAPAFVGNGRAFIFAADRSGLVELKVELPGT